MAFPPAKSTRLAGFPARGGAGGCGVPLSRRLDREARRRRRPAVVALDQSGRWCRPEPAAPGADRDSRPGRRPRDPGPCFTARRGHESHGPLWRRRGTPDPGCVRLRVGGGGRGRPVHGPRDALRAPGLGTHRPRRDFRGRACARRKPPGRHPGDAARAPVGSLRRGSGFRASALPPRSAGVAGRAGHGGRVLVRVRGTARAARAGKTALYAPRAIGCGGSRASPGSASACGSSTTPTC